MARKRSQLWQWVEIWSAELRVPARKEKWISTQMSQFQG